MTTPLPEHIAALKHDIVFRDHLRGASFIFHSTWGLFSPRQVDDGSRLLIEHLQLREQRAALDLGCGYGALGIVIAASLADAEVHLVDRDFVAIDFARRNAEVNGLANCRAYLSNGFGAVPEGQRFDLVVSNLPAKTGNEMLSILLHDAHQRLTLNGKIYLVTISGLRKWLKRNLLEIFGNYVKVKQGRSHTVAMAVRMPADDD